MGSYSLSLTYLYGGVAMRKMILLLGFSSILVGCTSTPAIAQVEALDEPAVIELREGLAIERVGRSGRVAFHTDAIELQIVRGEFIAPQAGDEVTLPDGSTKKWNPITANEKGSFGGPALRGGYVFLTAEVPNDRVMILVASGHSLVYVNGEPRTGDPYGTGWTRLPVALHKGSNQFLFSCKRGNLRAQLIEIKSAIHFEDRDRTMPDFIVGEVVDTVGALIIVNASNQPIDSLNLSITSANSTIKGEVATGPILPLATRKVAFPIKGDEPFTEVGDVELTISLSSPDSPAVAIDSTTFKLRIVSSTSSHKRTFTSEVDGSVQYYAIRPALQPTTENPSALGLVLTLHGAGVQATGQANSYAAKPWTHIVAPTNRRPFGFDWEDWGRIDTMEVLNHATNLLQPDPSKIYLTGHSMGGHGAWQVGATFPDKFAAIAPSAGWISFWSYTGAHRYQQDNSIEGILNRATSSSDTLALSHNYLQHGIYILHGSADDNVPVDQAKQIFKHLKQFHNDVVYHEQPGAGHWWNSSDEPGTDCVDWAPMFDFFARHRLPSSDAVRFVNFTTMNPGISSKSHWLEINQQQHSMQPSTVEIRVDPGKRRFVGTTINIARLTLDLKHLQPAEFLTILLDEQQLEKVPWPSEKQKLQLVKDENSQWQVTNTLLPASEKGPHRYGPFKSAFDNHVMFVYATQGNQEENAWALAKTRFDAETFWYRGNAQVDVVADVDFDPNAQPNRSIILYGNADTNRAWNALLGKSPVQVRTNSISVGDNHWQANDLSCVFTYPRPNSDIALVGVVSGSGIEGMRLTDRLTYFVSGVGYPDCVVFSPEILSKGTDAIKAAGFFGADWTVCSGDFVISTGQ